jgi:hypothetical protein
VIPNLPPLPSLTAEGAKPHQPWSKSGCSAPGCGIEQTETLDGVNGRRCAQHPPGFDAERAVELMRLGLPATAGAYVRTDFGGGM